MKIDQQMLLLWVSGQVGWFKKHAGYRVAMARWQGNGTLGARSSGELQYIGTGCVGRTRQIGAQRAQRRASSSRKFAKHRLHGRREFGGRLHQRMQWRHVRG
jgi:hypothetical protein